MKRTDNKGSEITRFILKSYSLITAFALVFLIVSTSFGDNSVDVDLKIPLILLFLLICGLLFWFTPRLRSNYIWWLISLIQVFFALLLMFLYGTNQSVSYLTLITVIYSSAIIYSWKFARNITVILVIIIFSLNILHWIGLDPLEFGPDSKPGNTLVLCFFLWLNVYIAKIGYEQIEHSYEQAIKYSSELEKANLELDQRVKERTIELEKAWIKNVKSLERAATMGQLTASLLHDLKSPLSSFNLSLELLRSKLEDEKEIKNMQNAYEQIVTIMEDTEGLMKDRRVEDKFDVKKQVETAEKLMENIMKKEGISLERKYKNSKKIEGSSTLFLRVILNLLMNSVEELSQLEKTNKIINISLNTGDNKQYIVIRDNGGGILKEEITKIFKPGYGNKKDRKHFGLGLSFVKKTVEEEFEGEINIKSEINRFTEIEIII